MSHDILLSFRSRSDQLLEDGRNEVMQEKSVLNQIDDEPLTTVTFKTPRILRLK